MVNKYEVETKRSYTEELTKKEIAELEPIATMGMCNTLALCILAIQHDGDGDFVFCKFSDDSKIHRCKINYEYDSRKTHFKIYNVKYYLSNFIRTDIFY